MQQQNQYFLAWIKAKLNKNFTFIECPSLEEFEEAEKELQALTSQDSDNNKLNTWLEKYLSDKQIKSMKAAYRKSVSRGRKNYSTRTADAIELDEIRSERLTELSQYTNVNKREYIKRIIDTEFEAMHVKRKADRESAELEIFHMLSKYNKVHIKALSSFPHTIDKALEILTWLKTENSQLENYSPKRFLAKQNGEKQVLALLNSMKEENFDVMT